LALALALVLSLISADAAASDSVMPPTPQFVDSDIATNIEAAAFVADFSQAVLRESAAPGSQVQEQRLRNQLADGMAINRMAEEILREHLDSVSRDEEQRFLTLFRPFLLDYMVRLIEQTEPDDFAVTNVKPNQQGESLVRTRVRRRGDYIADIDWVVRKDQGHRYQVIDMVIGDVSLMRTYRSEFGSVISREGMPRLLMALAHKVDGKPLVFSDRLRDSGPGDANRR